MWIAIETVIAENCPIAAGRTSIDLSKSYQFNIKSISIGFEQEFYVGVWRLHYVFAFDHIKI